MLNYPQTIHVPPVYTVLKTMTDIGKWLENKRLDLGLKRPEFCQTIKKLYDQDISVDYVYKIESGKRSLDKMDLELREAIRKLLKVSPEEWQATTGLFVPEAAGTTNAVASGSQFAKTYLHPVLGLELAGKDLSPQELSTYQHHPVSPEQYRDGMQVFRASDSMATADPSSIQESDLVFVDTQDVEPREGKVYVAKGNRAPGIYRARRIQGELYLTADNPAYLPVLASDAKIIGRVYSSVRITRH